MTLTCPECERNGSRAGCTTCGRAWSPGYVARELERGRRIRDQIRDADICPDCHYDGRHAADCPGSVASEEGDRP